jgi:hypothetical protein
VLYCVALLRCCCIVCCEIEKERGEIIHEMPSFPPQFITEIVAISLYITRAVVVTDMSLMGTKSQRKQENK